MIFIRKPRDQYQILLNIQKQLSALDLYCFEPECHQQYQALKDYLVAELQALAVQIAREQAETAKKRHAKKEWN